MPKISIIVPVYNVEQYLDKCLKSLVNQTLKDIEIIIVNDGTKDNSKAIIDKYEKKYKNIKSYKKKNGGLSSARNFGLKYAKGDYIAFVDSDDYVEIDMYEKLYKKALSKDYDMVVCNINYVYEDKIIKASSNVKKDILSKKDIKKTMINIYPSAWNKLFNKRLFNSGVLFKENVWYEDVEFLYRIYPYINSIGVVKDYFYNYVQREGTITSTFDNRVFNYIDNFNGIVEFYKNNNFYDEYKKELEYCYVRYLYATFIKVLLKTNDNKMIKNGIKEARKNVKIHFPKYRKNKYFYKSLKGIYLIIFDKTISKIISKKGE